MKKWKVAILTILVLGFVTFAAYIAYLMLKPDDYSIVPGISVEYHTKEELTELFWQNKDLLNTVKDSVLSSDSLMNAMNQERDGDIGVYGIEDKQYFTEEEWADIVSLFEKLHSSMIMMERHDGSLTFYIVFGSQKQDSIVKRTYLYWFPNEDERIYHEKPGVFPYGVFTQIDEGWYIVEQTDSR